MAQKTTKFPARSWADVSDELRHAREMRRAFLDLENSGLSRVPEPVFALTDLESLDLSGNRLQSIPERLWELPKLKGVTLVGNPIEFLPDRPGLTIDLPTYRRCHKQIKVENIHLAIDIDTTPEDASFLNNELKALRGLRRLTVGQWSFTIRAPHPKPDDVFRGILDSLADFKFLEELSVRGINLGTVPEDIRQLRWLKSLALNGLGLEDLPDWIGQLNLEGFSAIDNKLSVIPESFRNLKRLKSFHLAWNPLNQIPAFIFDLASLESLRLRNCNLRHIPADILRLVQLKDLDIRSNPVQSPPAEVANKGLDAIRDYWRQRADTGVDYLCQAKLIILGEPGAGKTSLARKIENPQYKLKPTEKSTEGIEVIRYQFPTIVRTWEGGEEKLLQRKFQVNIWDFGGQEIYHATHQFFLTKRSVYVLVCDDRKEDTDFSYWLQIVEMLTDASPLLIVQNEKQDRARDLDLSSLRARFTNLREAISTNLDTDRGLDRVIHTIRKELESLPHVGIGLPSTWNRVREALEQDQRDYISLETYLTICQERGFTRHEDKLQLSEYLHDLGICLHFQDDPLLRKTVVLKPSWGTDAVYRVLNDTKVIAARGLFTRKELDRIWSERKYSGMQDELLQLMMKFQLCYALEPNQAYIAPQLLSSEKPSYKWERKDELVVRYEYEFLPKGIVTRFIVAMHRLISEGNLVWKTGVVLERDGSKAEIIEEYSQRKIRVRVSGLDPHGLFAIVDEHLERLHASFPRLKYERFLPCPCVECQGRVDPYGFALDHLIKMVRKDKNIQCHMSGEMIDAARLVKEILPGALRREFYDSLDSRAETTPQMSSPTPEVFVSYSRTKESNAIVDRLQKALDEHGIRLVRDSEEVRYKDSIREFMRRIGQGKAVVVVISDRYLKSENCMFELVEIAKAQALRERIFPIVLSDANIYKPIGRVRYVQHWEKEIHELDEALKSVHGANLTKLQEDLNAYAETRQLFDGITDTLRDMNALTPDQHEGSGFEELIGRIRAQLGV